MFKSVQGKQGLVTGSCGWLATTSRQKLHTCQACQKLKRQANWSTTGQNRTTGCSVILRLELVTQSSHEAKPRASPVLKKNLTLHIPFLAQYKYPFYPWKKESFQREFWEKNLREKQGLVTGPCGWLAAASRQKLHTAKSCTRARHARSWSVMLTGVLQDKIGQLAVQ